jgi:hypothetical protein
MPSLLKSAVCIYRVYTKEWCGFNSKKYWNRTILLCTPCINRTLQRLAYCVIIRNYWHLNSDRTPFITMKPSRRQLGYSRASFRITVNLICLCATSSKCCFRPSLAEPGVSSVLQPAGALRCQCGPAHWHSTIATINVCLPNVTET